MHVQAGLVEQENGILMGTLCLNEKDSKEREEILHTQAALVQLYFA
ncbi:MAG: hypothetical protein KatS3mg110_0872 [Pirellulaceae bacterium]|nr:MAG: hypothetical protein KatS3mg110_0872 [Pirellulaceae bacterium]